MPGDLIPRVIVLPGDFIPRVIVLPKEMMPKVSCKQVFLGKAKANYAFAPLSWFGRLYSFVKPLAEDFDAWVELQLQLGLD